MSGGYRLNSYAVGSEKSDVKFRKRQQDMLESKAKTFNLEENVIKGLKAFFRDSLMEPLQVKECLTNLHPAMKVIYDFWENSIFGQMYLTSVGIVIANTNIFRVTGDDIDLTGWFE
ncbi:MAG: LPO_1073/Vpar_1526 family protein [Bacillota bacterium]